MNINFSTQVNNNTNCSFGKWKQIVFHQGIDETIRRASAIRTIIEATPGAKVCFKTASDKPWDVSHSIFAMVEFLTSPKFEIFANNKLRNRSFRAIKNVLYADTADDAEKIAQIITNKFNVKA